MKTNIVLVGFDLAFLTKIANKVADSLEYKHIDLNSNFDVSLLNTIDMPLKLSDNYLQTQEQLLVLSIMRQEQVVVSMSADMYVSNENYKFLEDSLVLFIESNLNNKYDKELIKFIKKRADLTVKQENINLNDIIKNFKG